MNEKWKEFLKAVEKKCPQTHIYTQPEECLIDLFPRMLSKRI